MAMIESVPQDELTEAMNTLRETIGAGLDALHPRAIISHFRNGQDRLAELAPLILLGRPIRLPELKPTFEVKVKLAPPERQNDIEAVSGRFDAVFTLVNLERAESHIPQLIQRHGDLLNQLRLKIDALDPSGAGKADPMLQDNLERLVPDFLRSPEPLTYADIIAGLDSMRPSAKAEEVEEVLESFLREIERLKLECILEPAIDPFFQSIRDVLRLINPLSLKDAVKGIYDAIRAKVRLLDPDALADSIHIHLFDPLIEPLKAIDPADIKRKVNEGFDKALNAVSDGVKRILDDIVKVIDEQLGAIRAEIQSLLEQIKKVTQTVFESLKKVRGQFERFVFVGVLERLNRGIDNLGVSFDQELSRVRNAFDKMVAAIPV
jgi:hypothetical protein